MHHFVVFLEQTLSYYEQLLTYTKSAVTRNYSEKSINNILDYISSSDDMVFMEKFYQTTLDALVDAKNDVSPFWIAIRNFIAWGLTVQLIQDALIIFTAVVG